MKVARWSYQVLCKFASWFKKKNRRDSTQKVCRFLKTLYLFLTTEKMQTKLYIHHWLSLHFCHTHAEQTYLALEAWAIHFVRVVTTVIIEVTTPSVRNTLIVATTEFWFRTLTIGTMTQSILLITVVTTVILEITEPSPVKQSFKIDTLKRGLSELHSFWTKQLYDELWLNMLPLLL